MGSSCDVRAGSCESGAGCETEKGECGGGRCPCGTECGGDPIECASGMWTGAFFQAMKQTQVEILKAKIQKAWGSKMDKAADAVLEAMETQWQSMLAQGKAKGTLREKLRSLWQ